MPRAREARHAGDRVCGVKVVQHGAAPRTRSAARIRVSFPAHHIPLKQKSKRNIENKKIKCAQARARCVYARAYIICRRVSKADPRRIYAPRGSRCLVRVAAPRLERLVVRVPGIHDVARRAPVVPAHLAAPLPRFAPAVRPHPKEHIPGRPAHAVSMLRPSHVGARCVAFSPQRGHVTKLRVPGIQRSLVSGSRQFARLRSGSSSP